MSEIVLTRRAVPSTDARYALQYLNSYIDPTKTATDGSHIHNCVEIYLNVQGDVSFLVKNEMYPVCSGDMIVTRAGEFHHCVYQRACLHEHFCLWIDENAVEGLLSRIRKSNLHRLHLAGKERERALSLFFALAEAEQAKNRLRASACLLQIVDLIEEYAMLPDNGENSILPDDFQRILDEINENYGNLTNIVELGERFFISMSTLHRWFFKYLHISPKAYLDGVKLSNAKRMLGEGKSVTAACFDCGYSDCSHFIRVFKKKFGVTPRQYKSKQ